MTGDEQCSSIIMEMTHLFEVVEITCTQERHQSVDIIRSVELNLIKSIKVLKPYGNE